MQRVEARCRALTRQVSAAGLVDNSEEEAQKASEIDQALFGSGGSACTKVKPPGRLAD